MQTVNRACVELQSKGRCGYPTENFLLFRQGKRCFALQTQPVTGDLHVLQLEKDQIRAGVPYEVAVHLDWERGLLELFIDGACVLRDIHFQVDLEPRYIGLYNWRSRAVCGFSEILVGGRRPYPAAESPLQVWRVSESQNRREEGSALTRTSLLVATILLVLLLVATLALNWWSQS
ncbi:unnamed protein product [Symbiodinium sp. CCMP2456]|nr:unnamed protein product [Symbiodinium sp. CCMP2456]